jgi:menaquinone-dependent protoporphyrinogen oxidase
MARVLVVYATKHHSTQEIAEAIADRLRADGHDVDCRDAGDATAEGYDAVILGSAVYAGRWRSEARHFLRHERDRLAAMPFWIFSSGPVGEQKQPTTVDTENWLEPRSIIETAEAAGVREHVVFGGRVPQDPGGFIERAMQRNVPEELSDLRDWEQIRAWAAGISATLTGAAG